MKTLGNAWIRSGFAMLACVLGDLRAAEPTCYDLEFVPATTLSSGSSSCSVEEDGFTISVPIPGGSLTVGFGGSSVVTMCTTKIEEIPAHYERVAGDFEVRRTTVETKIHMYTGCTGEGTAVQCNYTDYAGQHVDWILGERCVDEEYPHPEGL